MLSATSSSPSSANLSAESVDRQVGFFGLLWSSEGSIIGSGWLFGALTTVTIAGPSAIIGWIIASLIVILLALVHAELGGLFPVTGGTSRFPHYAFGSLAGGTFGWMSYLQAASVAPIEVLAAVEYFSSFHFASTWYDPTKGSLHGVGWIIAIGLMVFFVVINLVGIAWFARINAGITWWKIAVPVLTVVILLVGHFHSGNFTAGGGFFAHQSYDSSSGTVVKTTPITAILTAISSGGIVFSLLGFEQAAQLGGEAKNPADIPKAIIISILIGGTLYVLIQIAFVASLDPALLAHAGGWAHLADPTHNSTALKALGSAPFYGLVKVIGISWLAFVLRVDAVISPSGTGMIYTTSASRISYGLSKNGYIPRVFEDVSSRKVPVFSIVFAAIIGLVFLLPFPSWSKLVGIVTDASVLMYASAPLALGALRLSKPELPRLYKLPGAHITAPLAFVCANWIVYWAGWSAYTTLLVAALIGYFLFWLSATFKLNDNTPKVDWIAAPWIFSYLIGMAVISYFGGFGPGGIIGAVGIFKNVLDHGGNNDLGLWGGLAVSAGFSLVIYYWAMASRLPSQIVDEYVKDVYPSEASAH